MSLIRPVMFYTCSSFVVIDSSAASDSSLFPPREGSIDPANYAKRRWKASDVEESLNC